MKSMRRVLTICLIVFLSPVLIVWVLLGTAPGLSLTTSVINRLASSPGTGIEISGLGGVLGGPVVVDQVSISDSDGVWLTVTGVEMDLARMPLLTGRIDASRLSVQAINVARRPTAGDQSSGGSAGLPRINAKVDNIFVQAIALDEPVLGEAADLQLTGSLLLRENPLDLSGILDLVRVDGKAGEISSEWKIAPETNALDLKLSASEPQDGLLARALQIEGLPAVDVEVNGVGTLNNWQADLEVSLDQQKTVDGSVSLAITEARQSIEGSLRGFLAPLVPAQITPFFAGETQIELSVERDGERTLRLHRIMARSALVSVNATGHVLPAANEVDLSADVEFGRDGSQVAFDLPDGSTIYVGYTDLTTSMKGTLEQADWSLSGSVASLSDGSRSVTGARLSGRSPAVSFLTASGPFDLTLQVDSLASGQTALDELIAGTLSASVTGQVAERVLTIANAKVTASQIGADGNGRVDLSTGDFDVALTATVAEQNQSPWEQLLGRQATGISGQVSRSSDGILRFNDVMVESGNLQAQVSGGFSPDSLQLDGTASLTSLSTLNDGLAGAVDATVSLSGTVQTPQFSIEAAGKDVTILDEPLENLALEASGSVAAAGPNVDVKLTGRYTDQPISVSAAIKTDSDGNLLAETLDLVVPGAEAQGNLKPDSRGILVGELDVDITSLAELGPLLLQEGLSGSLSGKVVFTDQDAVQKVEATLTSDQLDLGAAQLTGTQASAIILDPQNALTVDATVASNAVSVSGTGVQDVNARVSGTRDALQFDVDAIFENAPASVTGQISSGDGSTSIDISDASGEYASIPVELTEPAKITLTAAGVQIDGVRLRADQGSISIDGTASDQLALTVAVNSFPLALFEQVAPTGLGQTGTIDADAKIDGTASNPSVSYDLRLQNVSVSATRSAQLPSIGIASNGTFENGILKTEVAASGDGLDLKAAGTVQVSDTPVLDLTVNGSVPVALLEPLAPAGMAPSGSIAVNADVSGTTADPVVAYDVRVSQFSVAATRAARLPAFALASKGDFSSGVLNASATGSGSGLNMAANGTVDISGTPAVDLTVRGTAPVSLLGSVARGDLAPAGSMTLDAKISGTAAEPSVSYDLRLSNVSVAASREAQIPSIGVVSTGTLEAGLLTATATATGGGMNLRAGGTVDLGAGPALDLSVDGNAPFEFAAVPLSSAGILIEGGVNIALTIGGTPDVPQLSGRLTTSNATFIESNSALTIRDIAGQIDFTGTRAQVTRLEGRVGSNGRLSVSGSIDVDRASGLPADLRIAVTDGTYIFGEIISAQYDAELSVSGPLLRTGAIGGTVTLRRTDISIPERLPASIPFVDVRHVNASRTIIEQAEEISPSSPDGADTDQGGLQLDLTVNAPNRIFFRGRGIDSEFGGSLRVFGAVSNPRASGTFSMIRGRLDLLNRRFDFDRGTIVFAGPMDPSLDFQTTTTVSGTSYSIVIEGTASSPEISFTSSPSMPQDEILSNLFFNRNLSRLSPLQIAQLANAVSQLSGTSSGEGLFGTLRNLTGLADLNLIPDEEGNGTALGIGSYLNDRTYINIEKGLSGGTDRVVIEMELTDTVKLRGEADSDGETKAGVFFERDY